MSSNSDVGVAILTWNSADHIVACLDSLQGQGIGDIVVVDNASQDNTLALLRSNPLPLRIIAQETNTGFAAATNRALCELETEYKLCLNDDAVLGDGYVQTLVDALRKNPDAASAVGKLLSSHTSLPCIDSAGILMDFRRWTPLDRGHLERDESQFDSDEDIFGPSAAAAMYRSSALESLADPPFDESLFAYYEDVDLAWRLRNAGWRHLYRPKAIAHHFRRGPGTKPKHIQAKAFVNRYIVWAKNQSLRDFVLHCPTALPWESARIARRFMRDPTILGELPRALLRVLSIIGSRLSR